jgi:hypothetical protein
MHLILSEKEINGHIIKFVGKIDKQVEEQLKKGFGGILEQILEISIEAYSLRQTTEGSYILIPKKLANKKCTINPNNRGLIDPKTNKLSDECI